MIRFTAVAEFVYRMTIGELPFVTGIYPLGGRAGEKTSIALTGWICRRKRWSGTMPKLESLR